LIYSSSFLKLHVFAKHRGYKMGFQTTVNLQQAPAVAGDFASSNPRTTVLVGEGGLVAGAGGVVVGKFAWVQSDGKTVVNHGTFPQAPAGFVHRDQQALISVYLQEASMVIPEGFPVTLHNGGDFYAKVEGATDATIGATVYADYADGSVTIGSASTGASATGSIGATTTATVGATFTATGSGTDLTTSAVTGFISPGDVISGTGVTAGTTIVSQTSGTAGGAGVYVTSAATTSSGDTLTAFGTVMNVTAVGGGRVSVGETVSGTGITSGATVTAQLTGSAGSTGHYRLSLASTAYSASGTKTTFGTTLNVTAVASGTMRVGDPITGTGVPANSVIATQVSGTVGSIGIYTISNAASAYAASTTLTTTGGVLTSFKAQSACDVSELTKISTWG
jgi:hypothetical protein